MAISRKVALAGATGNLGPALIEGLIERGYEVTVLSRSGNPLPSPLEKVKVVKVDWLDRSSVVAAITDHSAVVCALPLDQSGTQAQHTLIDACLAAGVPRFVPSSWGSDFSNAQVSKLPVYAGKVEIVQRCQTLASEGKLSYVSLACGPFLDWCIGIGLFLDVKNHKVTYYDGGDVRFSSTTLRSAGKALAACLDNWEKVQDRVVRVQDAVVTQKQLVEAAKKVQGTDVEWEVSYEDTETLERDAQKNFESGNVTPNDIFAMLKRSIWGEGNGSKLSDLDNELLGLSQFTEKDVQQVVARYC